MPDPELTRSVQEAADALPQRLLDELRDEAAGVEVTTSTPVDSPGAALLDAARGAVLLVVGSRGYGGFSARLLGSVSQHVAHHARCPVVIVPADQSASA